MSNKRKRCLELVREIDQLQASVQRSQAESRAWLDRESRREQEEQIRIEYGLHPSPVVGRWECLAAGLTIIYLRHLPCSH